MQKSSLDASIAPDASGSASGVRKRITLETSSDDDDDLENMLQEEFERSTLTPPKKGKAKAEAPPRITPEDCVARYHEMIRRTLVDWGDEILDKVAERFAGDPKVVLQIDLVRKESIDPLRTWSALPM